MGRFCKSLWIKGTIVAVLLMSCELIVPETNFALVKMQRGRRGASIFRPGDAVRITILQIWRSGERQKDTFDLDNDYSIDSDGYILMPIIGKVRVVGHTRESLIEVLKTRYSPYIKDPFITVTPLIRVTMQGAFNRPGAYRIDPQSSLWELVAMAGGPSETCDLNRMWVERGGKIVNKKLLSSFERGYSLADIGIRSGDQILAPERGLPKWRQIMQYSSYAMSAVVFYLQVKYWYERSR